MKKWFGGLLAVVLTFTLGLGQSIPTGAAAVKQNLALGKSYTLVTPYPIDTLFGNTENAHPDDTGMQLTDGVFGGTTFSNPAFIGRSWQGSRIVTIDLETPSTIQDISVNLLQDNKNGIFFPREISFSLSLEGSKWEKQKDGLSTIASTEDGPITQKIGITDVNKVARYVRVEIPFATWLFMDEMEVLGTLDKSGHKLKPSSKGPKTDVGYPIAGSKQAGGVKNEVLLYTGEWQYQPSDWISYTKEDLKPYVSYVNKNGVAQDYMFDSFLFLPYAPTLDGANYGSSSTKPTNKVHWESLLDRLFRDNYELDALNAAVTEAKAALSNKKYEAKVVIAIPYPRADQNDFGDVDGDGISENMNPDEVGEQQALLNREKVVKWYIDEVNLRWKEAGYTNLKLSSFYWFNEFVSRQTSTMEDELIRSTSSYVHNNGMKFQWIPYYFSRGWSDWKELGFDTAIMQPNYMFHNTTADRVETITKAAYDNGMGIEFEMNDAVLTDPIMRAKYYTYLNTSVDNGIMKNAMKGFYQQVKTILKASAATDPDARAVYDDTYQFLKGTYQP